MQLLDCDLSLHTKPSKDSIVVVRSPLFDHLGQLRITDLLFSFEKGVDVPQSATPLCSSNYICSIDYFINMTSEEIRGSKPSSFASKLQRLNLCGTRRNRNKTSKPKLVTVPDTISHVTHTPDRPPRPVLASELPPFRWNQQATMEVPRGLVDKTDREFLTLVGDAARQRRKREPVPSTSHTYQDNPRYAFSPAAIDPHFDSYTSRQRTPFSRRHRDRTLTATQHTSQHPTARPHNRGHADVQSPVRLSDDSDLLTYSSSVYSTEGSDRQSRPRPNRTDNATVRTGNGDEFRGDFNENHNAEVSDTSEVDINRLERMGIAKKGICGDCDRYGYRSIIPGTLTCGRCGREYDCSSYEEVYSPRDTPRNEVKLPLGAHSPHASLPSRPIHRPLKPPPRLQDRAVAKVTPLVLQTGARDQRQTFADEDSPDSPNSPISPVAVTKAIPSPQSVRQHRPERKEKHAQASAEEIETALNELEIYPYMRLRALDRGVPFDEVGRGPIPAIYAAQALSTLPIGQDLLRTGEVKSSEAVYVDRPTDRRRSSHGVFYRRVTRQ